MSFLKKFTKPSDTMEAEVDLDIRPFMNVLLILIPFLASVAVYTRLSILPMSLPPNVGAGMGASAEKPKLKITLVVESAGIKITYGEKLLDSVPKVGDDYNYVLLAEKLKTRQADIEIKNEIIVAVKDNISFKYVVHIMDVCRETGFARMGLAGATENPMEGE